jgi:hypothetical protein
MARLNLKEYTMSDVNDASSVEIDRVRHIEGIFWENLMRSIEGANAKLEEPLSERELALVVRWTLADVLNERRSGSNQS